MTLRGQGFQNNNNHLFLVSTLYRTHHKYTILLYLRHIMFRLSIITPYRNKGANQILEQHRVATNAAIFKCISITFCLHISTDFIYRVNDIIFYIVLFVNFMRTFKIDSVFSICCIWNYNTAFVAITPTIAKLLIKTLLNLLTLSIKNFTPLIFNSINKCIAYNVISTIIMNLPLH